MYSQDLKMNFLVRKPPPPLTEEIKRTIYKEKEKKTSLFSNVHKKSGMS